MTKNPITYPIIADALRAGEYAEQTKTLLNQLGISWTELQQLSLNTSEPNYTGLGRAWTTKETTLALKLSKAGCSQRVIANILHRPRSGVSYALATARGETRTYAPRLSTTARGEQKPREMVCNKPLSKSALLLREQAEWQAKYDAERAQKAALRSARARV